MIPDYPTIIILSICGLYIYARNLMTEMTILMLHKNVSRETSVKQLYYIILRFLYGNVEGMLVTQPNSNNRFQNTPRFLLVPCVC